MESVFSGEILNITPFKKGFVFATKAETDDGRLVANFYGYDAINDKFTHIKKSVFLKVKFGYEYEDIAKQLGDYVSCDIGFLADNKIMAIFPNGEYNIFNPDGSLNVSSQLTYHGASVCDIAVDGQYIWCAVPDENAIIKYSPREGRILLRVGGGETTAFEKPCAVTLMGNTLYICNQASRKIRTLNTQTNSVRDYRVFNEKVYKYINVMGREFVWLRSGLYVLD
ncbi:MAG: hypothetical protein NC110_06565 [Ruminococcus sp.]|nr:hypothetical protein [Ruminococcus sp.]